MGTANSPLDKNFGNTLVGLEQLEIFGSDLIGSFADKVGKIIHTALT